MAFEPRTLDARGECFVIKLPAESLVFSQKAGIMWVFCYLPKKVFLYKVTKITTDAQRYC